MIPYGRHSINDQDIQAAVDVLRSDWLTTGPKVTEFEEAFAARVGAKHAVAVNSGTAALHLAMLVARIGRGDRVVTSPNTFLASANCAAFVGATPDFSDIDPVTYNLCPDQLARTWKSDTRAVVAVDYAGQVCDMPAIADVARAHNAIVIEDACHAVGGAFHYGGETWNVGGHSWADMTTFSFHPVKTMTTGEGGMLVTDDDVYAARAKRLRHHGMLRNADMFSGLGDPKFEERGPWYYEMQELGFNFRVTDFQCALGLSQLKRLAQFTSRRRQIVEEYNDSLAEVEWIQIPRLRSSSDRELISWHLYTLQIDFAAARLPRAKFMNRLLKDGVGTQVLYIPVHLQPWYRKNFGYAAGKCPQAERNYLRTLSLPLHPEMSASDIGTVVDSVKRNLDS